MRRPKLRKYLRPRTLLLAGAALLAALAIYVAYLDWTIRTQFEGKRWALPARVYANPLELYPGKRLSPSELGIELGALGYRVGSVDEPGGYNRSRDSFDVMSRAFAFWDGAQAPIKFRVSFSGGRVAAVKDIDGDK